MHTGWLAGILLSLFLVGAMGNTGFQPKLLKTVLEEKRDRRRILLLYSRDHSQRLSIQQQEALRTEKAGLVERDLDVIVLIGNELTEPDRRFLTQNPFKLTPSDDFKGWLIGKDGGVKHTFKKPIESGELFRIIDSMPMRQAEARKP